MRRKDKLLVLDFDGFLINSYGLLKLTFAEFGLDIGDEERFRNRRKFLKYLGGGKEFVRNLVLYSLPKKKKIRQLLTEIYREKGKVFTEYVSIINRMIDDPSIHVGILSRNYTLRPGETIRVVLENSGIDEHALDFIIPIPTGVKKNDVLEGMKSYRYRQSCFCGDEIGDYNAAMETAYDHILMASYGFDTHNRLIEKGKVPAELICETPPAVARRLVSLHGFGLKEDETGKGPSAAPVIATSVI